MRKSENTPETAARSEDTTETSKTEQRNQLEQVARLLRGDESEPGGDQSVKPGDGEPEPNAETQRKKGKPESLADLAETLGLEVADLYGVKIGMGDNTEPRTLGELKDFAAERDKFEVDRLTWEEDKAKRESEFLRSSAEMNELISMLPRSAISRELLLKVADKRRQAAEREEARTLEVIAEWTDSDVRARDEKAIGAHLADYGLPANYLDTILDHRVRKFLRDATLRKQRIDAALAQVKTVTKPGHKPSSAALPPRKESGHSPKVRQTANQVDQIASLLRTGLN